MGEYRFTSDREPEDEELATIMREVAQEAKRKAEKAQAELDLLIQQQITQALERRNFPKT